MKLCKDCKWIFYGNEYDWCNSPKNGISLVTGEIIGYKCNSMRAEGGSCGWNGKMFEEKPKKKFWIFG